MKTQYDCLSLEDEKVVFLSLSGLKSLAVKAISLFSNSTVDGFDAIFKAYEGDQGPL